MLFTIPILSSDPLPVRMSHGGRVTKLPDGFTTVAVSANAPFAAVADEARGFYAVQFHPEVHHTPHGALLIRNFVRDVAGCSGDWTMGTYREEAIARIREQVGSGRVLSALSGGVDSAVSTALVHEAVGDQLVAVFIDHGLLRKGEREQVETEIQTLETERDEEIMSTQALRTKRESLPPKKHGNIPL